jgi:hypothetical protein
LLLSLGAALLPNPVITRKPRCCSTQNRRIAVQPARGSRIAAQPAGAVLLLNREAALFFHSKFNPEAALLPDPEAALLRLNPEAALLPNAPGSRIAA